MTTDTTTTKPALNLFANAKKVEKKPATAKEKNQVQVKGFEADLILYNKLKADEKNAKTQKEMIGGKLKEVAKAEYMKAYLSNKSRPETFKLVDGAGSVMCIVMDAYKKVEDGKVEVLSGYDVIEKETVYTINKDVLARCGEAVSRAIMEAEDISEEDKANLILAEETQVVKKGTIDRLMTFDNPELLFNLIEPTIQFK